MWSESVTETKSNVEALENIRGRICSCDIFGKLFELIWTFMFTIIAWFLCFPQLRQCNFEHFLRQHLVNLVIAVYRFDAATREQLWAIYWWCYPWYHAERTREVSATPRSINSRAALGDKIILICFVAVAFIECIQLGWILTTFSIGFSKSKFLFLLAGFLAFLPFESFCFLHFCFLNPQRSSRILHVPSCVSFHVHRFWAFSYHVCLGSNLTHWRIFEKAFQCYFCSRVDSARFCIHDNLATASTHTQKLLHRECAQAILHTEAFTQRCSYTQKHFQLETFMRRCFCTQEVYTKSCFYTECFNATRNYTLDLSHRDAFTHNLLQTETPAFTSLHAESVATEKRLHTEAWRHTDAKRRSPQIAALYLSFGRSLSVSCRNDRLAQVLT